MAQATSGYNGNANLPKAGTTYSMTADQIDEYRKCMASPSYFAENYFKIVTLDNGLQLIKLYDFQKEASDAYLDTNKLLMATSRQIGKTTIATVIILHYVLFNEHKSVFVLANKAATAQEVLSRVQLAYEYLPHWLKCGVVEGTYYDAAGINAIASIPSRDELLAKFLGSIQSPITNFARVIKQIAEKNEEVA